MPISMLQVMRTGGVCWSFDCVLAGDYTGADRAPEMQCCKTIAGVHLFDASVAGLSLVFFPLVDRSSDSSGGVSLRISTMRRLQRAMSCVLVEGACWSWAGAWPNKCSHVAHSHRRSLGASCRYCAICIQCATSWLSESLHITRWSNHSRRYIYIFNAPQAGHTTRAQNHNTSLGMPHVNSAMANSRFSLHCHSCMYLPKYAQYQRSRQRQCIMASSAETMLAQVRMFPWQRLSQLG